MEIKIGRSATNDYVMDQSDVSKIHAVLHITDKEVSIRDLNSSNGTFVNNRRIEDTVLKPGDSVHIASHPLDWERLAHNIRQSKINDLQGNEKMLIGRDAKCQILFNWLDVSGMHACLSILPDGSMKLDDLNSTNGTFVNGKRITTCILSENDDVLISNKYPLDWKKYKKLDKKDAVEDVVDAENPNMAIVSKSKRSWILAVSLLVIGVLSVSAYFLFFRESREELFAKYKDSVVMIYNDYIYEAVIGGGEYVIPIIYDDNEFQLYDPDARNYMSCTGTGFFISDKGELITNRHVAEPWENPALKKALKEYIKDFLLYEQSKGRIKKDQLMKLMSDIEIGGRSLFMGIVLNDTHVSTKDDLIKCTVLKSAAQEDIDLSIIQTTNKTNPASVKNYFQLGKQGVDKNAYRNGTEVFSIGFPAGFSIGATNQGIKTTTQNGLITREADGINFGHNIPTIGGASGSPVFNAKGQLIGISYITMGDTSTFNLALLSKHALELYNKTN